MKVGSSTATLKSTTVRVGLPGAPGQLGLGGSATAKPADSGIARQVFP
jgi:hypothetical protein